MSIELLKLSKVYYIIGNEVEQIKVDTFSD